MLNSNLNICKLQKNTHEMQLMMDNLMRTNAELESDTER